MKKIIQLSTMALICAALLFSCTKPKDGIDGKNGKDGTDGAKGEQGPQGTPGNAGVMMYTYGSRVINYGTYYNYPATLDIDKYLIYAYYKPYSGDPWRFAPGFNTSPLYQVVCYIYSTRLAVDLRNVPENGSAYSTPTTWLGFRIVVVPIPDANITTLATAPASASKGALDYSNYAAVAKYYGLPQ